MSTAPSASSEQPRAFTVRQVARQLSMPVSTLYRSIQRGEIPAVKIGGTLRILADDLQKALERARVSISSGSGGSPSKSPARVEIRQDAREGGPGGGS